jgi:hypothetical protein
MTDQTINPDDYKLLSKQFGKTFEELEAEWIREHWKPKMNLEVKLPIWDNIEPKFIRGPRHYNG